MALRATVNQQTHKNLRIGMRLGKYRLDRKIGVGGFADVYAATDTLLGIRVALKIPNSQWVTDDLVREFRREVKLTMELEHPNILAIRDASFIGDHFVIVSPLAVGTLDERLKRRMRFETAFSFSEQILAAAAFAHRQGVIHCDIKPENILLFDGGHIRLGDFGIAKVAQRTISGSGTGTLGYMSPEQAMGKPSARSDVFSIGLIIYRLFSGRWPEYPFEWPFPGAATLRRRLHPDAIAIVRKSAQIAPYQRYRDAVKMLEAWEKCRLKATRFAYRKRRST